MIRRSLFAVHLLLYSSQMSQEDMQQVLAVNVRSTAQLSSGEGLLQQESQALENQQKEKVKNEAKTQAKVEVKTEAKTEGKAKVEAKAEAAVETKADAKTKVVTKVEQKGSAKVDESAEDFNIMSPMKDESDNMNVQQGMLEAAETFATTETDQQAFMDIANKINSEVKSGQKVSQDDIFKMLQEMTQKKNAEIAAKAPAGEDPEKRAAAKAILKQTLKALNGGGEETDGVPTQSPASLAAALSKLAGIDEQPAAPPQSAAQTKQQEEQLKANLEQADKQSAEDDKTLSDQIDKDKKNIQTLQQRLENAIQTYQDHSKLFEKKKLLVQKMKELSNEAKEASHDPKKGQTQQALTQNKAQADLIQASQEAQQVMDSIEKDVDNGQKLLKEEFQDKGVISQAEKDEIVAKAVENAKKEVEEHYKGQLAQVQEKNSKQAEDKVQKDKEEYKRLQEEQRKLEQETREKMKEAEKKEAAAKKKEKEAKKKEKQAKKKEKEAKQKAQEAEEKEREAEQKKSEATAALAKQSSISDEQPMSAAEQDQIYHAAATKVVNEQETTGGNTEAASNESNTEKEEQIIDGPSQKAQVKQKKDKKESGSKHGHHAHSQQKSKTKDDEDDLKNLSRGSNGDIYFDKEFESEDMRADLDKFQEEESQALKEPLKASDMKQMEETGRNLFREITDGVSNPTSGKNTFWQNKAFFKKHLGF